MHTQAQYKGNQDKPFNLSHAGKTISRQGIRINHFLGALKLKSKATPITDAQSSWYQLQFLNIKWNPQTLYKYHLQGFIINRQRPTYVRGY